ncbi:UNVERIFIED_CONTAM: hypothetical protein Sradi_3798400 [Sesamum radiatum]|uniref:Uncharacterized protein n=1 Tax=Sesamum radiatum TaxID=300843 RepID=A0AAW2Q012_SESRA
MSSTDESVRYVGETLGDDLSKATSKRLGSLTPSYVADRRWSLRRAACRLLDEPLRRTVKMRRMRVLPLVSGILRL